MAAERAGMRARLPSTAASSARVHQCVERLPSSCTNHGTQPSFPAWPLATHRESIRRRLQQTQQTADAAKFASLAWL